MTEHLKVVGKIEPPEYKDPVKMLRNIADRIEAGTYDNVTTIAVALQAEDGLYTFGGGTDSDMKSCAFLFSASAARLYNIV
jgi:hypothetical protein